MTKCKEMITSVTKSQSKTSLNYPDFEKLMYPIVIQHVFSQEDQLEEFRDAFKEADRDFSGYLEISEFYAVLVKMGSSVTKDQLIALMSEFDVERTGKIGIDTFVKILTNNDEFEFKDETNKENY